MFYPRAGLSLQNQETRLQFCSKAGIPLQTQGPGLQFYQGLNTCGCFPLLSAPHSLFSIWTDLRSSEKITGAPTWMWGEWIWLTGPSGLHRNSPHGIISVSSGFLTRSEIRKSQSPFAPTLITVDYIFVKVLGSNLRVHSHIKKNKYIGYFYLII